MFFPRELMAPLKLREICETRHVTVVVISREACQGPPITLEVQAEQWKTITLVGCFSVLGGGFKFFLFSSLLGEDSHFD